MYGDMSPNRAADSTNKILQLRYNLFTFGFGTRKCLGQHEAEVLIKTIIAQLVVWYDLTLGASTEGTERVVVEEGNWVPVANIELELRERQVNL